MAYHDQQPTVAGKIDNVAYTWYQQCNCCPYGYHIDLDFVRYCESIGQQADRTGSVKRRRDRRRQRQSMEVLLGLEPPVINTLERIHQKAIEEELPHLDVKKSSLIQDDLYEVVSDFERTLQRSKGKKLSNNLPDVTAVHGTIHRAPSLSSMSSASGSSMTVLPSVTDTAREPREYDTISIESYGLSPAALQNIREQMALSLERTKELEERVKLIPSLQAQLSVLKEEKRQLLLQIKAEMNIVNRNYINNTVTLPHVRLRSNSLTHSTSVESIHKKERQPPPIPRRDFGVMCSVLTRNVGVGHQNPKTKSVSTTTVNGETNDGYSDKWYKEKIRFLTTDNQTFFSNSNITEFKTSPILQAKATQTQLGKQSHEASSQTVIEPKVQRVHNFTQTLEQEKSYNTVGVSATIATSHASNQAVVKTISLGVSEHTIDDFMCSKCTPEKLTLPLPQETMTAECSSISLASLTVSRSKSFNLGEDKLNLTPRNRTVACQYEPCNLHKACQHEIKMQSKSCQNDVKVYHKGIQYESFSITKFTDTKDLRNDVKHVGCNTKHVIRETSEIGCSTNYIPPDNLSCSKCTKKEKDDLLKKEETILPSKIPRPQIPTTPVENRKFRRQDTYTKIPASAHEASGLSGLDLSPKHDDDLPSPLEKVKQSYKLSKISSSSHNGVNTTTFKTEQESTLSLPESDLCQSNAQGHRKKVKPSKEMQAALKVLNDSLQKGQTKNLKNQLKNAINIIQQEWFKISSLINADPLDVEDYLDCFEDISSDLLHYVVNMVDVSGNTAMHYAVSHGNFDVVSILLDSKVCDINQLNTAGYTSVMLVSLAEVCSPTHANVVRRLFQLADVNIRAKQHGQTALMLAVSHGRLDMVQMLLEAGADINIQDEDGSTALMCASEHGHIDIVKHFLSQPDCDSTIIDVDGSTALKIAMEAGHRHIGVLLYAHERNLHSAPHSSKLKRNKSTSLSPKVPSSPLPLRSSHRALTDIKLTK